MPRPHLTTDCRYLITHMHYHGFTNAAIARRVGCHRATVGGELARNRDSLGDYHYESAQRLARARRTAANHQRDKLRPGSALGKYVRAKLRQRWSPEQIVNRLKRDHPRNSPRNNPRNNPPNSSCDPATRVTPETVYPSG